VAPVTVAILRCCSCGTLDRVPVDQLEGRYARRADGTLRCPYLGCNGEMREIRRAS
jgi:hypothetical protein